MILAKLSDRFDYLGIHPLLDQALRFLTEENLAAVSSEKTLLSGEDLFVTGFRFETVPFEQTFFESHQKYLDLHVVTEGAERIDIAHPAGLKPASHQDDLFLYTGGEAETEITLKPGSFLVVFPGDAHRLKIPVKQPGEAVTRVVFKIRVHE